MPELINKQHEAFCKGVAVLKLTGADAVRHARFETDNPRQRAYKLTQREDIKTRIEELEAAQASQTEAAAAAVAPDAEGLEPGSLEWLMAEHRRNLALSKSRADTKESRATLIEIGKLQGQYIERSEITSKVDPLLALSGAELQALRSVLITRMQTISAPTIDITISPNGNDNA